MIPGANHQTGGMRGVGSGAAARELSEKIIGAARSSPAGNGFSRARDIGTENSNGSFAILFVATICRETPDSPMLRPDSKFPKRSNGS